MSRSGRENAATKGRRYVVEGRLTVTLLHGRRIRATCRGGGAVYRLGHDRAEWWCECPARGLCAHLVALQLVATPESDG